MSEFYVPDITEFHVGFEFEHGTSKWVKSIVDDKDWIASLAEGIKVKDIRVKHLDREDIESLGWGKDSGDCDYVNGDHGQLEILHEDEINGMLIKLSTGYGACMDYYGRLKNKSELIKELNKIGI